MKNLRDTKNTITMNLLDNEICIFEQDRPYKNTDMLIGLILRYNLDKNLPSFKLDLKMVEASVQIAYNHPDGVLMKNGVKIEKFIYIKSLSTNKFSVNGKTNLKEALHTSCLKHLQSMGLINAKREIQNTSLSGIVLPERSGLKG